MARVIFIFCMMTFVYMLAFAQEADPTDVSAIQAEFDAIGLPTVAAVERQKEIADSYYDAEEWEKAAEAFQTLSKNANWLANLVRAALGPYYSASYDDRKDFPHSRLSPLVQYETQSNIYIRLRNEAMVKEGLSYAAMGEREKAVSLLYKALDLINIDNIFLWKEAREMLLSIIGVE